MEPRGGPLRDMGGPRGAYASRGDFLLMLLILKNGQVAESGTSADPLVSARAGFILN